jgi:hypothetical protein
MFMFRIGTVRTGAAFPPIRGVALVLLDLQEKDYDIFLQEKPHE